jgi:hypothetical protein
MLMRFTAEEKQLLAQAIPSLALPALSNPSEIDLYERAHAIEWPDPEFCERAGLRVWMKILGALPSTYHERLQSIHIT